MYTAKEALERATDRRDILVETYINNAIENGKTYVLFSGKISNEKSEYLNQLGYTSEYNEIEETLVSWKEVK